MCARENTDSEDTVRRRANVIGFIYDLGEGVRELREK